MENKNKNKSILIREICYITFIKCSHLKTHHFLVLF